jgi:solute carrier family 25 protein 39/40
MRERPDLSFPSAPDMERDVESSRQRRLPVEQGGTNLREVRNTAEFEWPESGPSGLPVEEKEQVKALGPFGAKVMASMTGAVVVSLLSKLDRSALCASS